MNFFEAIWYNITNPLEWYLATFYGKGYFEILYTVLFELWLIVPFLYFVISKVVLPIWLYSRQLEYSKTIKYILLAIDAPKREEQSIKSVERIFEHIQGMHGTFNFVEKWVKGMYQLSFSCEIVSIDGYIQLLLRVPDSWRDNIEAAIFGQYPEAEITLVEDYVNTVPSVYPNETHDMWGVEWGFDNAKNPFMPFRTYPEFQDSFAQIFVDPLAGVLETMSKIGKGEQIWLHMVCTPLAVNWYQAGQPVLDKMLGREEKKASTGLSKLAELPVSWVNEISEQLINARPLPENKEEKKDEKPLFGKYMQMSPGEQDDLKAMQRKMNQLAFNVKMRYGYYSEHAVTNKVAGVNSVIGSIKQFNAPGRQGFKPELKKTGTKAAYFRVKQRKAYRQRKMTAALKGRSTQIGMPPMIWSTEEIATVFHFPGMEVKAPMLKRTETVKSSAPINLPFEEQALPALPQAPVSAPAAALPWEDEVTVGGEGEQQGYSFDYDSDYFEEKFAVDKKAFAATRDERQEVLDRIAREDATLREVGDDSRNDEVAQESLAKDFAAATPHHHESTEEAPSNAEVLHFFAGPRAVDASTQAATEQPKPRVAEQSQQRQSQRASQPAAPRPEKQRPSSTPQQPANEDDAIPPNLPFV